MHPGRPSFLLLYFTSFLLLFMFNSTKEQEDLRQSKQLYREEFETYETLQRRKHLLQRGPENGLRTRYVEFAETEFKRPSSYFPIPFLSPVNNRLQVIPARTLHQLIRQHIAHNRMKQLALQNVANNPILQGVRQITELRQTPFRRWSAKNTQSYEEKRRQWKAELRRRLHGDKLPIRVIPPLLINGPGRSSMHTEKEPEQRYFVTYSPQTRIYQVSRRPPPFLYTTDRDALPEQLERYGDGAVHVTTEEPTVEGSTETEMDSQQFTTNRPPPSLQTTETPTETPILVVLQKAQLIHEGMKEHKQRIISSRKPTPSNVVGKQILFLDDYDEQEQQATGEEAGGDAEEDAVHPPDTTTSTSAAPFPLPSAPRFNLLRPNNTLKELEEVRGRLRQQIDLGEEDDSDLEDGDDDLFFFKPGVESGRGDEQPFRILVHDQDKTKIR